MGLEHLTNTMNKPSDRGLTAHSHVTRLIEQFGHWPIEALESNYTKLPTLRILRMSE